MNRETYYDHYDQFPQSLESTRTLQLRQPHNDGQNLSPWTENLHIQPQGGHERNTGVLMEKSMLDTIIRELQAEKRTSAKLRQRLAEGSEKYAETMETVKMLADIGKDREESLQKLIKDFGTVSADSEARLQEVIENNRVLLEELAQTKTLLNEATAKQERTTKGLTKELAETKKMLVKATAEQERMVSLITVRELISVARNCAVEEMGIDGVRTFADHRSDISKLIRQKNRTGDLNRKVELQSEIDRSQELFKTSWTTLGLNSSYLTDFKKLTDSINAKHVHATLELQDYKLFVDNLPKHLDQYRSALQQVIAKCFFED